MLRLYKSTTAAAAASARHIAAPTAVRAVTTHARRFSSNDDSKQQQQEQPARPFWKRPVGMALGAYLAFCAVGFLISPMEQAKKKQHAQKHKKKDEPQAEATEDTAVKEDIAAVKPAAAAPKAATIEAAEPRSEPQSSTPHVAAPAQPAEPAAVPVAPVAPAVAAPAAVSETTDEEDEAAADAAFEAEYNARPANRERSAAAHAVPGRPHVFSLTAAEIPRRVQLRTSDLLLHVYDPHASVSGMQRPVLDAVAKVLHEVQSAPVSAASAVSAPLQVLTMDSSANVFPGFFAAQGEEDVHRLSKLIFYPKCGSQLYSEEERSKPECQPSLFAPMHARTEKLLDFAHERIGAQAAVHPESTMAFDLAAAHALGQSAEPAVRAKVGALLRSTVTKPLSPHTWRSSDVAFVAPCGSLLRSLVERQTAMEFESYDSEAEQQRKRAEIAAIVDKHSNCQTKEKQHIKDFIQQTKQQLAWMEKTQ